MKSKPRSVFDTNTVISAFLFDQSHPGQAMQMALDRGELLLSLAVVEEYAEVIRRKRFDRYVKRKREKHC